MAASSSSRRILRTPSPQNPRIFFDTQMEREDDKYGNDHFNGVTIGICAMNCKVINKFVLLLF